MEPALTWITLSLTYIVNTERTDHWDVEACLSVWVTNVVFLTSHHDIKGLAPNFVAIWKSKTNKTLLPPAPPTIQRGKEEKKRQIEESRVVKRFDEGGGCLNTGLNKAFKKRMAKEKGWMKRERTSERHSPKTWTECMCLLTQLITLYRGHGLTIHHTHTQSSGKGRDVSSNCNSILKVWMNLIRHSSKSSGLWRLLLPRFQWERRA